MCFIAESVHFLSCSSDENEILEFNYSLISKFVEYGLWLETNISISYLILKISNSSQYGSYKMHFTSPTSKEKDLKITQTWEIDDCIEFKISLKVISYCFTTETFSKVICITNKFGNEKCLHSPRRFWAVSNFDSENQISFTLCYSFEKRTINYLLTKKTFNLISELKAFFNSSKSEFHFDITQSILNNPILPVTSLKFTPLNNKRKLQPYNFLKVFLNGNRVICKWWNVLNYKMVVPIGYQMQVEVFGELFLVAKGLELRNDTLVTNANSEALVSSSNASNINFLKNELKLIDKENINSTKVI